MASGRSPHPLVRVRDSPRTEPGVGGDFQGQFGFAPADFGGNLSRQSKIPPRRSPGCPRSGLGVRSGAELVPELVPTRRD